ncbi:MAG: hypothetical protein NXH73_07895 [Flavobacteriaceae bacterium]|nr:hypothetical protein [Flavobacteriaceae bacterium]
MTKEKKNTQKTDGRIFRVFELITESIGWLQIVASPFLIGLIIGAIIYFPEPTMMRLGIGTIVAILGLVIGIFWATKQWKGKGTIWFMSRIMATPELDYEDRKTRDDKTNDNDKFKKDSI